MTYWWLSFADGKRPKGTQFLGVAIVPASEFFSAVMATHVGGYNPGGEVVGYQYVSDGLGVEVPAEFVGRLLTKEDATKVDDLMHDAYSQHAHPTGVEG